MGIEEPPEIKKTSRAATSRLKQERELHGWTQSQVAERIGTTQINISRWENGITVPGPYYRQKLGELFGRSLQDLGLIKNAEGESTQQATADFLPQVLQPPWNIPHRRNPFFTGREETLHYLSTTLSTNKVAALTQAQAISGLGGIGKTQIAVEYAYRYRHLYDAILWVTAASRDTLVNGFVTLSALLGLPEPKEQEQDIVVAEVKRWLATHRNWLLILDNVDDLDMAFDFLPMQNTGSILLTTRSQALGSIAKNVEVEKMGMDEGMLFLLRRAKVLASDEPLDRSARAEQAQAAEIVTALDGLPLALDQAGAYIDETKCGFQGYLDLYRTRRKALLQRRGRLSVDHPESVTATWSLSFQRIEQNSPAAANLLRLCAFLHAEAIPEEIITKGAAELGPELGPAAADPLALNEAIEHLLRYSLIRRFPEERSLSIHRLVQAVLRDAMDASLRRTWAERALRAMNCAFPNVEPATWAECQRCLPHAQTGATYIEEYNLALPEAARLLNQTAAYLIDHAHYSQAEAFLQRAMAMRQQLLEPDHPDTATTLNDLGKLYYTQGKYSQAESCLQRALTIREQTLGAEHPATATSLNNLALLYDTQGKYSQAEPLFKRAFGATYTEEYGLAFPEAAHLLNKAAAYLTDHAHYTQAEALLQRVLALRQELLEPDHPDTAVTLNDLGKLYYMQGKYSQAGSFLQQALTIREQRLGAEHPATATSLNNLALLYYAQGKYSQAEHLLQRALDIRQRAFEAGHPDIAQSLSHLAELYTAQGKYEQAELLYSEALNMQKQILGLAHPDVAKTLNNLALVYRSKGEYARSESFYAEALEIQERVWGSDHPDVAQTLDSLARLYRAQGEYTRAEPYHLRALDIRERVFGPNHPHAAQSLYSLAKLYYSQGKYLRAEELCQQALHIQKQWLGRDHPAIASTLGILAKIYQVQQKHTQAEALYELALTIRENALGSDHPLVAVIISSLAEVYQAQGKYSEAKPLILRSLALREHSLGREHPYFAYSLSNLAENYFSQGDYTQAESLYKQALAIREQVLGATHPQTASTYHNLATLYLTLGRYEEAESLYNKALAIREQTLGPEHPDFAITLERYTQLLHKTKRKSDT